MFQRLKIALKRQKKLLVIFLITIFLPSVLLSIFGVIALRNEKFRQLKQIENQQLQTVNAIKSGIETKIAEINQKLENIASYPSFQQKDYPRIKEILKSLFDKDSLTGQVFLVYENEEPLFPLFNASFEKNETVRQLRYDKYLQEQIKNAEQSEYIQNDFLRAASIYNDAFLYSKDKSIKASFLNLYARNLVKAGKFESAAVICSMIIKNYPDEKTESGLMLELYAKLMLIDCFRSQEKLETATDSALAFFQEIVENKWNLTESQFRTYGSIIFVRLTEMISAENEKLTAKYKSRFELLQKQYQNKTEQWLIINNLKSSILPDLKSYLQGGPLRSSPVKFSRRIGNEDYLVSAVVFPGQNRPGNIGLLGIKLNSDFLKDNILSGAIEKIQPLQNTNISVTSLSGDSIRGRRILSPDAIITTALFDNNFPPWRLELVYTGSKNPGEINILSSFYFWTIMTLIIILVFGSGLIMRIVARETEILKIKSDFVSSVSHEFKTPLTSMKALTERLETGKVTQPAKVKQYLTLLSSDIERLIRLVNNILNFSAIDEGKKVYKFEKTEMTPWLEQVVNNYRKENFGINLDIHIEIEKDIPEILIDRDAMAQVIFNLLDNAAKFSPGNKKEVSLTAGSGADAIIIRIRDKGIGIRKDEAEKIFEKFYRGKGAVDYSIKGTGLGLAFVKYTVEAHKGKIELESEPGWSSVFTISLPVQELKQEL